MFSPRHSCLALLALLGVALLAPRPAAAENDTYTVTDLGTLPGKAASWNWIQNLNNHGSVAVYANNDPTNPNAFTGTESFLWDNGKVTLLPGLPGAEDTMAMALNDNGVAVGYSGANGFQAVRAVMWERGKVKDLGTYGSDPYAQAWNLNNHGQAVGYSYTVNLGFAGQHPVLWDKGKVHLLQSLPYGGDYEAACDINDKGQIVGQSGRFTGPNLTTYPVLWESRHSAPIDLGVGGQAQAINNRGQIVGSGFTPEGQSVAFLWEKGVVTFLGTIGTSPYTAAFDINSRGQIVGGTLEDFTSVNNSLALLWEGTTPVDLNLRIPFGSGWKLLFAAAINERGQIVGYGNHNGQYRAFLLTPRKK